LSTSFGRGAATSFQADLQNSDCILIMGSNMAEAHPVGFRFPMKAREKGAKLIHVDPRFSRTSASATTYVPIRAGSDIVFLGGLIHQVLTQERWFREYVLAYTNATTIISDKYVDAEEDATGLFSGFDANERAYDLQDAHWQYASEPSPPDDAPEPRQAMSRSEASDDPSDGIPRRDPSLQHPNCVLNILRRHYARYTPEMVADQCGCTEAQFLDVAEQLIANSGRERTSAVVYALGWTQHTTGVQIIRTAAILQLLLGNMGRPGGGIMAMRGHANIQGSTDIPTLFDLLPGYQPQPSKHGDHQTLSGYIAAERSEQGLWSNFSNYTVSLLKAWFGEGATPENDWGYDWIPKVDRNYSQLATAVDMAAGKLKGYFLIGQNPAAGAPNARLNREGLKRLDWLVVRDFFPIESATFWKEGPDSPDPATIGTEVFFLPAANSIEKAGTFTNTERTLQWHDKAINPPGDCRSDLWFMWNLGRRLKALYANSTKDQDQGILNLTWDYAFDEPETLPDGTPDTTLDEPDAARVLREINGYTVASGDQLQSFSQLQDDGSTASGCWIYCGVYPDADRNRSRDRTGELDKPVHPNWGWAWPDNRRMLYNRASADPEGNPWSDRKRYVWWDADQGIWTGLDTPDFERTKPPSYRPNDDSDGMAAIGGDSPFILKPDGKGWLFGPRGTKDGPLPTHYEPMESPVGNALYRQRENPTTHVPQSPLNPLSPPEDPDFPIVGTTYRVTEHYLSGPMSRFNSWLNELQPAMFVEMSPQLAAARGVEHGDWVVISSRRSSIEARAMVTPRIQPLRVQGTTVHQVGLPIHFGWAGEVAGSAANELIPIVMDPNVAMHEGKAFACQVQKGRLRGASDGPSVPVARRPRYAPMATTPDRAKPEGRKA
jgi:formate dehydrogenase major subunit